MGRFLTDLDARLISDGPPSIWSLLAPLIFLSDDFGAIIAPVGIETDFASVPRLPVMFLLAGGTCDKAAVIHDYLYSESSDLSRADADRVLKEASLATGAPAWRANMLYAGVRVGGSKFYKGKP
jgi:hypothetical protein